MISLGYRLKMAQWIPLTFIHCGSSITKVESQDTNKADSLLNQIALKTPNDPKVWKTWAYLALRQNDNNKALEYINRSLALDSSDDQLLMQKLIC